MRQKKINKKQINGTEKDGDRDRDGEREREVERDRWGERKRGREGQMGRDCEIVDTYIFSKIFILAVNGPAVH